MKYSDIIGGQFYNIGLTPDQSFRVDAHCLAASHHRARAFLADDHSAIRYHWEKYWGHILSLLGTVYRGDFSRAKDTSLRGMERRENWDPRTRVRFSPEIVKIDGNGKPLFVDAFLPDPELFASMQKPDPDHPENSPHLLDSLLSCPHDAPLPQSISWINFG